MDPIEWLGHIAGACSVVAILSQIIQTFKMRSAEGISLIMCIILVIGAGLWVTYGTLRNTFSIILTNSILIGLTSLLAFLKLVYDKTFNTCKDSEPPE